MPSKLERERIALELEEEKRAWAGRGEKRLLEQTKKIESLSSTVFFANREEASNVYKKEKRHDTWYLGNLVRKKMKEIATLEMEKFSNQRNIDCIVDLAAEQTTPALENCEKLSKQLVLAREEATVAHDRLASSQSSMEKSDWLNNLSTETQEIQWEFEDSKILLGTLSSFVDKLFCLTSLMLTLDHEASSFQSSVQVESIIGSHEMIKSCLQNKIQELEDEKFKFTAHRHIEETNMNVYNSRSHTIFRMIIESRERSDYAEVKFSCHAVHVSFLRARSIS